MSKLHRLERTVLACIAWLVDEVFWTLMTIFPIEILSLLFTLECLSPVFYKASGCASAPVEHVLYNQFIVIIQRRIPEAYQFPWEASWKTITTSFFSTFSIFTVSSVIASASLSLSLWLLPLYIATVIMGILNSGKSRKIRFYAKH